MKTTLNKIYAKIVTDTRKNKWEEITLLFVKYFCE